MEVSLKTFDILAITNYYSPQMAKLMIIKVHFITKTLIMQKCLRNVLSQVVCVPNIIFVSRNERLSRYVHSYLAFRMFNNKLFIL